MKGPPDLRRGCPDLRKGRMKYCAEELWEVPEPPLEFDLMRDLLPPLPENAPLVIAAPCCGLLNTGRAAWKLFHPDDIKIVHIFDIDEKLEGYALTYFPRVSGLHESVFVFFVLNRSLQGLGSRCRLATLQLLCCLQRGKDGVGGTMIRGDGLCVGWRGIAKMASFRLRSPAVLFCIVLYCIVLYCVVLYCIVLCCIVLYCIVLYCTVLILYCTAVCCTVLYCIVLYCMCIVLLCSVLYCTVLHCIVLYCIVLYCTVLYCSVLYCIVLYCTVLYCAVLCCIVIHALREPKGSMEPKGNKSIGMCGG